MAAFARVGTRTMLTAAAVLSASTLSITACTDDEVASPTDRPLAAVLSTESTAAATTPLTDSDAITKALLDAGIDHIGNLEEIVVPGAQTTSLFVLKAGGADALETWSTLYEAMPVTGRYPVIVGGTDPNSDGLSAILENAELIAERGQTPEESIGLAATIDAEAWIIERREDLEIEENEFLIVTDLPTYVYPKDRFTTVTNIRDGSLIEHVDIALIPTVVSWEVPAYLQWGGWNTTPDPEVTTAIFRHWEETYGAHLVAITGEVVEFVVTDPPATPAEAITAASEQYLVAPDIVWQGTENLATLAAAVQEAPVWYLWWD